MPRGMKLRPTTDMAKEGLFSVLFSMLDFEHLRVLDLFAGTGNIGLEFLSRGADHILFVEKNRKQASFIKTVIRQLGEEECTSVRMQDVFHFLREGATDFPAGSIDLVFADPPYDLPQLATLPDLILSHSLLSSKAFFILEHPAAYDFSSHPLFVKSKEYSAVHFTFFMKQEGL